MNLTAQFAAFIAGAAPDAAVREVLRQSLYDWLACGIAGVPEPVSGIVRAQALDDAGAQVAAMFGGGLVPARAAAFVNGTISHALDYDDTHFVHIGHPSVAVYPAVFAAGPASFDAALDAACIGTEVAVRMGQWLGRAHYEVGFHQTATAGAFGATAAVARLRGLSVAQVGHALGLAATHAAGLKAQFGTMGKPMNAGLAAECGVVSADLAARGMVSNPDALDGPQGFVATHHGQRDGSALTGLGTAWLMCGVSHKLHACCHGLHAMIAALGPVAVPAEQVRAVEITTNPRWLSVCNKIAPVSGLEVKFSYVHVAAMVLAGRSTVDIASYSDDCAHDPPLVALRERVVVQGDPHLSETAARVRIDLHDKSTREGHFDLLDAIDVDQKWDALDRKVAGLLGADMAARLRGAVGGGDLAAIKALMTS